eukprot:TRINITY_DN87490_c0_g1_i1.p1 TRINITY_DN87490_c0_g1~~TRINITY_DN87490_c0_g1_i1.p1  ORF type:complete len:238 (+),score=-25.21 TRINITY_DN87490_c0_g1_i1:2-715(+)
MRQKAGTNTCCQMFDTFPFPRTCHQKAKQNWASTNEKIYQNNPFLKLSLYNQLQKTRQKKRYLKLISKSIETNDHCKKFSLLTQKTVQNVRTHMENVYYKLYQRQKFISQIYCQKKVTTIQTTFQRHSSNHQVNIYIHALKIWIQTNPVLIIMHGKQKKNSIKQQKSIQLYQIYIYLPQNYYHAIEQEKKITVRTNICMYVYLNSTQRNQQRETCYIYFTMRIKYYHLKWGKKLGKS